MLQGSRFSRIPMDKDYESDTETPSRCTRQGVLLRIIVSAAAIITVLLIIIAIVAILTQKPVDLYSSAENLSLAESHQQPFHRLKPSYRRFTFDQLFSGKLFLKDSYEYNWLPDGSLLRKEDEFLGWLFQTNENVLRYMPDTFEETVFLDDSEYMQTLSSDLKYAYRTKLVRQVFRHSMERVFEIVQILNGTVSKKFFRVGPVENATLQAFYWNPNPDSHDFVYIHNYNVYYQLDPAKPENAIQLTHDGEYYFRYGSTDWLYEEEIFDNSDALWWSPSGRYVSYLRFDDRNVNKIFLQTYTANDPYVEYFELPYPKAGVVQNTVVAQFIWDRQNNKIVEAIAPEELRSLNESYYIVSNTWMKMPNGLSDLGAERLITVWTNREQNKVFYTLCSEIDCIMTLSQSFSINGREMWAEPREIGSIFPTKTGFFTILPHSFKNNIYNHIAHVELETNGIGKITKWIGEDYDVMSILGYYTNRDILTYNAYGNGVGENGIYKVPKAANTHIEEITSKMNALIEGCDHGTYTVDPTGRRAALLCHQPFENTKFVLMNVDKPRQHKILDGDDDAHLPFDKPQLEYGTINLPSGVEAHYMIMKPPRVEEGSKLPLILDLYGGPNSKKVRKSTPSPHFIQICSQYEVVVVNIDVRGTAGRGWNVKEPVYKNLGPPEARDTLDAIHHLAKKYPFIDENNIAVTGWSYGGFLSSQVAIKDQGDSIKCAISIAPVTDFKYYDTAYTERYMGMPAKNVQGYEKTNLIPNARNMTHVRYFLAHGEKDDNVHYQNSARWSEALQYENIHFTQVVYANEAHNLQGKVQHLYSEIQHFLTDVCFKNERDDANPSEDADAEVRNLELPQNFILPHPTNEHNEERRLVQEIHGESCDIEVITLDEDSDDSNSSQPLQSGGVCIQNPINRKDSIDNATKLIQMSRQPHIAPPFGAAPPTRCHDSFQNNRMSQQQSSVDGEAHSASKPQLLLHQKQIMQTTNGMPNHVTMQQRVVSQQPAQQAPQQPQWYERNPYQQERRFPYQPRQPPANVHPPRPFHVSMEPHDHLLNPLTNHNYLMNLSSAQNVQTNHHRQAAQPARQMPFYGRHNDPKQQRAVPSPQQKFFRASQQRQQFFRAQPEGQRPDTQRETIRCAEQSELRVQRQREQEMHMLNGQTGAMHMRSGPQMGMHLQYQQQTIAQQQFQTNGNYEAFGQYQPNIRNLPNGQFESNAEYQPSTQYQLQLHQQHQQPYAYHQPIVQPHHQTENVHQEGQAWYRHQQFLKTLPYEHQHRQQDGNLGSFDPIVNSLRVVRYVEVFPEYVFEPDEKSPKLMRPPQVPQQLMTRVNRPTYIYIPPTISNFIRFEFEEAKTLTGVDLKKVRKIKLVHRPSQSDGTRRFGSYRADIPVGL
ncbi:unnamed protein product [Caenorhabditis bovis]|uniref:Peptidase S9 prolyl oligopeptidase catalytic domain-containing protein n=1 Tax=Caenorhabditis bovis TaxID=2654633 RepID=A0A8S1EGV4_9PELO|nr:unnamed protein product [Caenorhabditis bovis]